MSTPAPSGCAAVCAERPTRRGRRVLPSLARRQSGVALVMGMIVLVLLTLLGLTALGTSLMEERMAANAHDRIRAFQAAEAALRLCESAIDPNASVFDATGGSGGMYDNVSTERWAADWPGWGAGEPQVRVYPGNLHLVEAAPRCIVERLREVIVQTRGPDESRRGGRPVETARTYRHYRVTARGVGASDRTVVVLQSHLRLRMD